MSGRRVENSGRRLFLIFKNIVHEEGPHRLQRLKNTNKNGRRLPNRMSFY